MPARQVSRLTLSAKRLTAQVLLGLLLVSCVALIASAFSFQERQNAVRAADTDNQGWTVAQLEVDFLSLRVAVNEAMIAKATDAAAPEEAWRRARVRFDIFFSRADVLYAAQLHLGVPAEMLTELAALQGKINDLADHIDILLDPSIAEMGAFLSQISDLRPEVRRLSNNMLHHFIVMEETARADERALLFRFMLQSLVLLLLMVVSLYLAVSLWRDLEARTQQTERAEKTLAKAFQSALSAVIVTDRDGEVILCNGGAEEIFGLTRHAMTGTRCQELLDITTLANVDEKSGEIRMIDLISELSGHAPTRATARRANGEEFPAEVALLPDIGTDGRPNLIWFVRDISEQARAEERMRSALAAAQRHAAAKSMFLATMSHEMRTPLHGLIASLELIDSKQLDDKNRKFLKTAADCSERALSQVNDVLELTRLGETSEPPSPFAPGQVAADILEELELLAAERHNTLRVDIQGSQIGDQFMGRPSSFSRAIYNLAGNAVKFTENGEISISLTFAALDSNTVQLYVAVRDTGIGIAPEDQERVLEQFETVNPSEVAAQSGTGLGLPIARLAIERMGGKLALDSTPGEGSCFSFDIPLKPAVPEDSKEATSTDEIELVVPDNGRLLIVDDNEVNLTVLSEMVRRLGFTPDLAHDGKEGVEMALNQCYDFILMDVSMPVMNGREATRLIREQGACQKSVIIGVTALIEAHESARLKASGMNGVLNKPVKMGQLKAALSAYGQSVAEPAPESDDDSDFAELCNLVGSETALRLLNEAFQDVRRALSAMRELSDNSVDEIHRAVGATGMVGLIDLSDFLSEAEMAASKGRKAMLDELVPEVEDLLTDAEGKFKRLSSAI
ncbi:Sensor protein EvgS [Pseudoprimorskyibacter insulae]|uniref:histidine kinase n=1 Tax=Pseudoprimorskyibacter insulae TaxID=1695997 RepID=A0A2R8AVJ2_9RHOB|nr:Sensor protein EvgS [Pseudoprimorskyibacter insulae]